MTDQSCPHCGHPLRNHHVIKGRVYDRVAWFRCACGCEVNGSVESARIDGSPDG